MMKKDEYILMRQISELFFLENSGLASRAQREMLERLLSESERALELYLDLVVTCAGLSEAEGLFGLNKSFDADISEHTEDDLADFEFASKRNQSVDDSNVSLRGVDLKDVLEEIDDYDSFEYGEMTQEMLELLEMERNAPGVEIDKPVAVEPKRELIQKVESNFKLFPGKGNKALTYAYLALAACIMVFVGYVHFAGDSLDRPVVAKLEDSINAVWDTKLQMPDGFDDMVQSRYRLKEGFASILFKEGAVVTVEAPAELSLNSSGDMELFSGKIYAVVPQRAHGFTVKSGDCKIVDLGTEFGVEIDIHKNTQLHVTRGKTMLFSGQDKDSEPLTEVDAGEAKKVYSDGFVKDIALVKEKFVRMIDSDAGVVWNGNSNIGPSGDGVVFSESFEQPVVDGYLEDSVPSVNWVGSKEGYCATHRGFFNEGNGVVFSTPYGNQGFLLDYTNSGLVTSEGAIDEVLTAGTTYTVTFNAAYTPIVAPPKIDEVKDKAEFQKNLIKMNESTYKVELVAYEPGAYRADFRYSPQLIGANILATASGTVSTNDMSASDSIVFTPKADDPNLGKLIAIRLVKASGSVIYDNIKLRVWKTKNEVFEGKSEH